MTGLDGAPNRLNLVVNKFLGDTSENSVRVDGPREWDLSKRRGAYRTIVVREGGVPRRNAPIPKGIVIARLLPQTG